MAKEELQRCDTELDLLFAELKSRLERGMAEAKDADQIRRKLDDLKEVLRMKINRFLAEIDSKETAVTVEFLMSPIEQVLPLKPILINYLRLNKISCMGDLLFRSEMDLIGIRNIGLENLRKIHDELAILKLRFNFNIDDNVKRDFWVARIGADSEYIYSLPAYLRIEVKNLTKL